MKAMELIDVAQGHMRIGCTTQSGSMTMQYPQITASCAKYRVPVEGECKSFGVRVRRSETVSEPQFDEYVDMTCTMRNWVTHKGQHSLVKTTSFTSNPNLSKQLTVTANLEGPELLLTPFLASDKYPMVIQDQDRSFGSLASGRPSSRTKPRSNSISRGRIWNEICADDARQQEDEKPLPQPFSIPVNDVVVVDSMGTQTPCIAPVFLTTESMGYFEFTFNTSNAHDVFLAFLTNSLPYERIIHACSTPLDLCTASFDVETLTATRMRKRVESETLSEKMMRKLNLVANRIGEFSSTFSDFSCNCDFAKPSSNDDSIRQGAPRSFEFPTELEVEVPGTPSPHQLYNHQIDFKIR